VYTCAKNLKLKIRVQGVFFLNKREKTRFLAGGSPSYGALDKKEIEEERRILQHSVHSRLPALLLIMISISVGRKKGLGPLAGGMGSPVTPSMPSEDDL
jgi:hypothetical protein